MKTTIALLLFVSSASRIASQPRVSVQVYPGTELLNVVQLLSDSAQITRSTYQQDILQYFGKYKNHPAVQKARQLPFINCDFPLRMSWALYDFPRPRLHTFSTLGAYNQYFSTQEVLDYFKACLDFYRDTRFEHFYRNYQSEYDAWIKSFERNLYEAGLWKTIDSFYAIKPAKDIVFTLGALNCGSYSLPDMAPINPIFADKMVIMVAYGNLVGSKDSAHKHPDFYKPAWSSQLIWHEAGHAFIAGLFEEYHKTIDELQYIFDRDSTLQKAAGPLNWSKLLNENMTQAVTSYLRIKKGLVSREAELQRVTGGPFYAFVPLFISTIESWYRQDGTYSGFNTFFPVLLSELRKQYPQ